MAKLTHRLYQPIMTAVTSTGKTMAMLRSDGHLIKAKGYASGHYDAGVVRADLTLGQLRAIWERKYVGCKIAKHGDYHDDYVTVTAADAARRAAARARTAAKAAAAEAARREQVRLLPAEYQSADPVVVWAAYSAVRYLCGRAISCPQCGSILDCDRAIICDGRAICASHSARPDVVPDTKGLQDALSGITYHGPMLRETIRARELGAYGRLFA